MRHARVKAVNLKVGDVIKGMRIGQIPLVHKTARKTTVNFFVSNHGKIEAVQLVGDADVVVKRPVYNLTRKPKQKVRVKEDKPVANIESPVVVDSPLPSDTLLLDLVKQIM